MEDGALLDRQRGAVGPLVVHVSCIVLPTQLLLAPAQHLRAAGSCRRASRPIADDHALGHVVHDHRAQVLRLLAAR